MANVAASIALRRGLKLFMTPSPAASRSVSRSVHSTRCRKMSEHGGIVEPDYVHAEHMYNLDKMKHQKLKMTLAVWTCVGIGTFVPIYAVIFQQKKTASA